MDLEEVQVATYLRHNPHFLEDWLTRNADSALLEAVRKKWSTSHTHCADVKEEQPEKLSHNVNIISASGPSSQHVDNTAADDPIQAFALRLENVEVTSSEVIEDEEDDILATEPSPSVVPRTARKSVTSDLFHQWLASGSSTSSNFRGGLGGSSSESGGKDEISPAEFNQVVSSSAVEVDDIEKNNDGIPKKLNPDAELLRQNDKLMEYILNISNELDISVLCHKILVNVCHLTKADRSSLFLARGPRGKRYLEAKLFNVTVETSLGEAMDMASKESISIPFGTGICGHVAETKETIYIKDAYNDSRFNQAIDIQTGYVTRALVTMPVCNFDGEVIGVAQIMNKKNDEEDEGGISNTEFSEADLKVFQRYLTFCGIGIQNAQLFEVSILEYKKNKLLLHLAKSLFEEQVSLERLVCTIIAEAKSLLKCERCTVYLLDLRMYDEMDEANFFVSVASGGSCKSPSSVASAVVGGGGQASFEPHSEFVFPPTSSLSAEIEDALSTCSVGSNSGCSLQKIVNRGPNLSAFLEETNIRFQRVWELTSDSPEIKSYGPNDNVLHQSRRAKIAKYVASTAEVLNLSSVANWLGEQLEDKDGFVPKTMLCLPIYNGQRDVIGVAQLINKANGSFFNEADIALFEAFAIFCGIGIHNTKMYEGALKMMAKQKVALDCLSYHASASVEDTEDLAKASIPDAEKFSLYSYKFNDMILPDQDTYKVTIRMFLEYGLVEQFNIPYQVLCRWVLSVKKNYRPVSYHNWRHALNVAQTMFTICTTGKMDRFMDDLEVFGLIVACLCHDLDHRGTNNAFQSKVESPLAILYSTSTMEHHHFDQCVMILNSDGNNIFQGLNTEDYKRVMKVVEQAILSTDLALYFRKKDRFLETANTGEIDWQEQEKKELLCGMLMTACDVSAIAKPWEQQHLLAKRVADEFFDQGDLEKLRLNTQPIAMMDRNRKDELPKMQVEFIDVVCRPLYGSLSDSFPWIQPLLNGCLSNREKWIDLAEKVEMGLTWIDHDTIEKPIEQITLGTEDADDIEFTVETLKSKAESDRKANMHKKRSFKGPVHRSAKGGSFFHRRLSSKSPQRSMAMATPNLTHEIHVDRTMSTPPSSVSSSASGMATMAPSATSAASASHASLAASNSLSSADRSSSAAIGTSTTISSDNVSMDSTVFLEEVTTAATTTKSPSNGVGTGGHKSSQKRPALPR